MQLPGKLFWQIHLSMRVTESVRNLGSYLSEKINWAPMKCGNVATNAK
jgi:hypothetical protein